MDDKKSKYGRNKLPPGEKREIEIKLMLNSKELSRLKERFGGVNFRGQLRDFLLNEDPVIGGTFKNDDLRFKVDQEITYELKKIGNNINQIAFRMNLNDYPAEEETLDLLNKLQEIIINKLSGDN